MIQPYPPMDERYPGDLKLVPELPDYPREWSGDECGDAYWEAMRVGALKPPFVDLQMPADWVPFLEAAKRRAERNHGIVQEAFAGVRQRPKRQGLKCSRCQQPQAHPGMLDRDGHCPGCRLDDETLREMPFAARDFSEPIHQPTDDESPFL